MFICSVVPARKRPRPSLAIHNVHYTFSNWGNPKLDDSLSGRYEKISIPWLLAIFDPKGVLASTNICISFISII